MTARIRNVKPLFRRLPNADATLPTDAAPIAVEESSPYRCPSVARVRGNIQNACITHRVFVADLEGHNLLKSQHLPVDVASRTTAHVKAAKVVQVDHHRPT